jgi:hypothetical protein
MFYRFRDRKRWQEWAPPQVGGGVLVEARFARVQDEPVQGRERVGLFLGDQPPERALPRSRLWSRNLISGGGMMAMVWS